LSGIGRDGTARPMALVLTVSLLLAVICLRGMVLRPRPSTSSG